MKLIFIATLLLSFMNFAQADDLAAVVDLYETAGEEITPSELVGGFVGECYAGKEYQFKQKEALYVGKFKNAKGESHYLPMTTEHFYNDSTQPVFVKALTKTNRRKNWNTMSSFSRKGLSGADNNQGLIHKGDDFRYLYSTDTTGNKYTLSVSRLSDCGEGEFCPPPILTGCRWGFTPTGFVFDNCVLSNDVTNFKKVNANTLVSKRTADGWDLGPNNMTPDIGAGSYCKWTLKTPKNKISRKFH